jgi:ElaB/YqjD/DUF883 family membrane-anchored ribosome-binding protein
MSMYDRGAYGAGERIIGAITRHPEALLLLAAGVALMMRSGGTQTGRNTRGSFSPNRTGPIHRGPESDSNGVGERISDTARNAGQYVSEATDKLADTARSYASSAADYADDAARITAERSRRIAGQASETADYLAREQPWAVAIAGLVAGATVAMALPSTRIERRTLGDMGGRLRAAAGTVGEHLKEAGKQAGERLSEVAEERGLTSEGLKNAAREVGETFSSALTAENGGSPQASNRQQTGERTGPRTQTGQTQTGSGSTRTTKGKPSGGSSGGSPGGTRR